MHIVLWPIESVDFLQVFCSSIAWNSDGILFICAIRHRCCELTLENHGIVRTAKWQDSGRSCTAYSREWWCHYIRETQCLLCKTSCSSEFGEEYAQLLWAASRSHIYKGDRRVPLLLEDCCFEGRQGCGSIADFHAETQRNCYIGRFGRLQHETPFMWQGNSFRRRPLLIVNSTISMSYVYINYMQHVYMFFQCLSPIKGSFCARQPILRFGWMADFCTQKLATGRSLTQFLLQHRNEFTVEEKSGIPMKVPGAKWCQFANEFLTKQCHPNVSYFFERRCAMCFFHAQMLPMLQVSLASFANSSGLEYLRSRQVAAQLVLYLEGRGGSMQACNLHQYYSVYPGHKQIINKVPTFCASHKGLIAYTPDGTGSCLYPSTAATFCESAATRSLTTKDFCTVKFQMVQFVASMANNANLVIGQGLKPKRFKQLRKRTPKQRLRLQRLSRLQTLPTLSFPRLQTLPTLSLQAWHCTCTRWVVLWEEVNLVTTTSLFHATRI